MSHLIRMLLILAILGVAPAHAADWFDRACAGTADAVAWSGASLQRAGSAIVRVVDRPAVAHAIENAGIIAAGAVAGAAVAGAAVCAGVPMTIGVAACGTGVAVGVIPAGAVTGAVIAASAAVGRAMR